jgi:hypothetical protein
VRLERHVGGLSRARKMAYLRGSGWTCEAGRWHSSELDTESLALSRALHHQLTFDLTAALVARGWTVEGYSPRGYARMRAPGTGKPCSVPAALRSEARRGAVKVAELTYSLFLAALLRAGA